MTLKTGMAVLAAAGMLGLGAGMLANPTPASAEPIAAVHFVNDHNGDRDNNNWRSRDRDDNRDRRDRDGDARRNQRYDRDFYFHRDRDDHRDWHDNDRNRDHDRH